MRLTSMAMILWAMPFAAVAEVSAAPSAPPPTELTNQYNDVKSKVVSGEQAQRAILGSLYSINVRMKDMSKKRGRLTDRLLVAEGDVRVLARAIADLESKIEAQRTALSGRLRALYMLHGQGAARIIFSAQSSHEFDRNIKFLKLVTDRDYELIKDYEHNLASLHRSKIDLRARVQRLARIQQQVERQESLLIREQNSKSALLDRLKSARDKYLDEMRNLRSRSQSRLAEEIKELDTAFFERKGNLPPPVAAPVAKGYGFIQDEQFRYRLSHKGLFFKASPHSDVLGVAAGRVAYCGEMPGYGRTLVIDHGDHYYTVYGYLTELKVKRGDEVKEGQLVGEPGGYSPRFGPGLYFEIRHFSDAIDPHPWLKGVEEMKTSQL